MTLTAVIGPSLSAHNACDNLAVSTPPHIYYCTELLLKHPGINIQAASISTSAAHERDHTAAAAAG